MVKFGKNKFKALNKIAKNQKIAVGASITNKILKKKINADKKVSFQKEVLLKAAVSGASPLVKNVTANEIVRKESKKTKQKEQDTLRKPKQKPVEKRKKRQKTQIADTKLMLKLMNKAK